MTDKNINISCIIITVIFIALCISIGFVVDDDRKNIEMQSQPLPLKAISVSTSRGQTFAVLEDGSVWEKTPYGWLKSK